MLTWQLGRFSTVPRRLMRTAGTCVHRTTSWAIPSLSGGRARGRTGVFTAEGRAMGKRVLIVGAGPVGPVTALGLGKLGIDVTLIEVEENIVESPRAMG